MAPLILSAVAMTVIVGVRYLITSGLFAALTVRRFPGRLSGQAGQVRREIGWSLASAAIYGIPAGDRRLGVAVARLDANLQRRRCLSLVVDAGFGGGVPAAPRHLFLLDAPADASSVVVPENARRPSREPAADGMGSDEFSPVGGAERRAGHSLAGVSSCRSMSRCLAWFSAS
jgi:hypothetical protein